MWFRRPGRSGTAARLCGATVFLTSETPFYLLLRASICDLYHIGFAPLSALSGSVKFPSSINRAAQSGDHSEVL